jgi:type IV pilus assembly protein PilA
MTATTLRAQLRSTLLRQIAAPNAKEKNLLQKGFTLVELMIVIVIVGTLSAIALPNFLNQTKKAKLTEPQTVISAGLKQASALYQEGALSAATTCANVGITATTYPKWTFTCTGTGTTMTISAIGSGTDSSIPNTVGTGSWVLDASTGAVTKGTPVGL